MNIIESIVTDKIYGIVRTNDAQKAFEVSNALIAGGIKNIEIQICNMDLFEVINKLSKLENVYVAAGGIITTVQAMCALENGAKMLVSPIFQKNIVRFCEEFKIPVMTTVSTANEAYQSWKAGVPISKLYPATHLGGVDYISDLIRPMPFLNLMPTGAIKITEVADYIKAKATAIGIGSDLYKNYSQTEITQRAKEAINNAKQIQG